MKKSELKADLAIAREAHNQALNRALATERQLRELQRAIDEMRKNWRPVPITHPWQPRDPQCSLCDEPKDSPRHQEGVRPEEGDGVTKYSVSALPVIHDRLRQLASGPICRVRFASWRDDELLDEATIPSTELPPGYISFAPGVTHVSIDVVDAR